MDNTNREAWERFDARYKPMVVAYARRMGLAKGDAEDVGQETILAFVRTNGKGGFDPTKGRLRTWLFRIAHNKVVDIFRGLAKENVASARADGSEILRAALSRESAEEEWNHEWERAVLRSCMEEVKLQVEQTTYRAFELYVLEQWPVQAVAAHLHMSENAVYIAKNRVISRLCKIRPQMEKDW